MVYGDDEEQVKAGAKKLAQKFWDVRKQFSLEAPGWSNKKRSFTYRSGIPGVSRASPKSK